MLWKYLNLPSFPLPAVVVFVVVVVHRISEKEKRKALRACIITIVSAFNLPPISAMCICVQGARHSEILDTTLR
ncbi:hypothetical protein GGR50DRAFT_677141 [Xylaria sp. CBS 124048]|nr:hypothetical protein GGR50DRAFT_677141 [Xylaria sp. CBS 124048]